MSHLSVFSTSILCSTLLACTASAGGAHRNLPLRSDVGATKEQPVPSTVVPAGRPVELLDEDCTIELSTKRINDRQVVSDGPVQVIDYPLLGSPGAERYRIALLMFDARSTVVEDDPNSPRRTRYSPQDLGDTFFQDENGVHAFVAEASHGRVSLSGRVVGWIPTLPVDAAGDFRDNREAYAEMARPYLEYEDFDVVYFVAQTDSPDGMQSGWALESNHLAGVAAMGLDFMVNSEFWREAGGIGLSSLILPSTSWAHELMHTLGVVGHANSLDCDQGTLGEDCEVKSYGHVFSSMGEFAMGTHPDAEMQQVLGWLESAQVRQVTESGSHKLCPLETRGRDTKALSIPLDSPIQVGDARFDRLLVEYRTARGFDRYLARAEDAWIDDYTDADSALLDGVVVSLGYADQRGPSVLLDSHPETSFDPDRGIKHPGNLGKFADAILPLGETLALPSAGIALQVGDLTADGGIQVQVEYL